MNFKNKTCLLAHYSVFSAPNFGILFNIAVLQFAFKYNQKPLPRHLSHSVSRSLYIRIALVIMMIAGINNTQYRHLSKQFYECPFLNKEQVFECCKMHFGISTSVASWQSIGGGLWSKPLSPPPPAPERFWSF